MQMVCAGKVIISRKAIAQLIGRVFIQKAAVNLLSTVLDTPEFFWSAPDSLQTTYKKVCEYMELEERVEVLNNRFQVRSHLSFTASGLSCRRVRGEDVACDLGWRCAAQECSTETRWCQHRPHVGREWGRAWLLALEEGASFLQLLFYLEHMREATS